MPNSVVTYDQTGVVTRMFFARETPTVPVRIPLHEPSHAAAVCTAILNLEVVEVFIVLLLDTKMRVIAYHEVGRGSVDRCFAHPRDVFRPAVLANTSAVVIAHNHPSGDSTPSAEDHALTTRLVSAGKILGIEVLDHIIVGNRIFSFKEAGLLDTMPHVLRTS